MHRTVKVILALYLLIAMTFSFYRYTFFQVDGDLPSIVMASKHYQAVTHDPFGITVLVKDTMYPAPNRYFAHQSMSMYFKNMPPLLQTFSSPIDSIYISCALAKTAIQFMLIFLLAAGITGKISLRDPDLLLAAAIITPLFQVYGFHDSIGIIDAAMTYAFFYAGALVLLLLFFLPVFLSWYYEYKLNKLLWISLVPLAVVTAFHGPLNAPVMVLVCSVSLITNFLYRSDASGNTSFRKRLSESASGGKAVAVLVIALLVSLYSLYIGRFNAENLWDFLPLKERYARLPNGFYLQYIQHGVYAALLLFILLNLFLLRNRMAESQYRKLKRFLLWMTVLSILYILALPLGGYRSYRPFILRMDSVMPVTLALFFSYGITSYSLLKNPHFRRKKIYAAALLLFSACFIFSDTEVRKQNSCEKESLEKLAVSAESTVLLENDCSVLSWGKITDPADSEVKADLLVEWGVLKEKKLFYQR